MALKNKPLTTIKQIKGYLSPVKFYFVGFDPVI